MPSPCFPACRCGTPAQSHVPKIRVCFEGIHETTRPQKQKEGKKEGREERREGGKKEGKKEGREEGRKEGRKQALVRDPGPTFFKK
jgi:hypothetical protein